MSENIRYFNFPMQLLSGFMDNSGSVLNNIFDYALYEHCLKLYEDEKIEERMKASANYFNVKPGSLQKTISNGKILYDSIDNKSPKGGINLRLFWDYYKNEKSEFEKICLLGYLALKSIIQKQSYCKIDNRYWLARMDGKAKSCDFSELSEPIRKYANEYQTVKIKNELIDKWKLITYSRYTRGFFISFTMKLEDLIIQAEQKRILYRKKQRKAEIKAAYDKAQSRLNI